MSLLGGTKNLVDSACKPKILNIDMITIKKIVNIKKHKKLKNLFM